MNDELDPEIAAMLRREEARVDVPADVAARLGERLAASIAAGALIAGTGAGAGGNAAAGTGTGAGATGSAIAMKALPYLVTLVVGAGIGGGVVQMMNAPSAVTSVAPTASAITSTSTSASASASFRASASPSASIASVSVDALPSVRTATAPPAPAPSARSVEAGSAEDALVAERKVLDRARASLARGDHAAAMAALDEHASQHETGSLVEEREALRVRALADSGRAGEARATATRFRARWPHSVLLPAVDAASPP